MLWRSETLRNIFNFLEQMEQMFQVYQSTEQMEQKVFSSIAKNGIFQRILMRTPSAQSPEN